MSIIAIAAAAALLFQPEPAEQPRNAEPTVESLEVVAPTSQAEEKAIESFVADIADESGNGRLARWDRKICPGVTGMREAYGQYIVDKIAAAALSVGLEVDKPGCQANVLIVMTDDSDDFLKDMVKRYPDALSRYDLEMTAGRKAFKAFMASPAPVRWWHVTERVTADGQKYEEGGSVRVRGVSRLRSTTRDDFDRAIIVVDSSRVGKIHFPALADYLTFVALAQIDPEATPPAGRSILSLFLDREAGKEAASAMTDWDHAYLKGLYGARRDTTRSTGQKKDIVRDMTKKSQAPGAPPKADE